MISAENFIDQWIGCPYEYNGRTQSGVDCYGLVVAYYRDVRGINLPQWDRADTSRRWVVETMSREVDRGMSWLDAPQQHCIAVGRRNQIAHHMGIYTMKRILQVSSNSCVSIIPLSSAKVFFGGEIEYGFPI